MDPMKSARRWTTAQSSCPRAGRSWGAKRSISPGCWPEQTGAGPDESKRAAKEQVIAQLRADYGQLKLGWNGWRGYDRWFQRPINNARLNTVATYFTLVPAFQQLLAKHGGDLPAFYAEAQAVAALPKEGRHEKLIARANETRPVAADRR